MIAAGYEAVECSIDGRSLVGALEMDHHGERSHLEGVAVRGYRDHLGARRDDPRFVVTGRADEDATFCVAALAGFLPARAEQDLSALADLINRIDTVPLGIDLSAEPWGETVLVFQSLCAGTGTAERFTYGALLWAQLVSHPPRALLGAARASDEERRAAAAAAPILFEERGVRVVVASVWGFDVWYGALPPEAERDRPEAWERQIVLVYDPERAAVSVGTPNRAVAERLLGEGGLRGVFPILEPAGWGGRESVGGSPRGVPLAAEHATAAARLIVGRLVDR